MMGGRRDFDRSKRTSSALLFLGGLVLGILLAVLIVPTAGGVAVDVVEVEGTVYTIVTAIDAAGREITLQFSDSSLELRYDCENFAHRAWLNEYGVLEAQSAPLN